MPNVSIVTPARITNEHELAWLGECIESVRAQTIPCEHVIWNDASPLDLSSVRQDGIVWRNWEQQRGVCWTRNAAVATARGPLILPLDADDRLEPDAAERMREVLKREGPHCFVYSDVKRFGAGVEMEKQLPAYDFGLILRTCLAPVTILYPKQAWAETGGYDPEFESGMEDWAFLIAIGIKGYCGVKVDGALLHYRSRAGSRQSAMRGRQSEIAGRIRQKFLDIYQGNRPEGCCAGSGHLSIPSIRRDTPIQAGLPVEQRSEGQTRLRYMGDKRGNFSVFLRPTRRFVTVSTLRPIVEMTVAEADWLLQRSKDFTKGG